MTSDLDRGMIVGARQGGLSISETADLLGLSHTTVSRVSAILWTKTEGGLRKRARLVEADRKVAVMQISTHYNSGMQKSIPEHTTHQTSKWIGYSSRRLNKSNKCPLKCSPSV